MSLLKGKQLVPINRFSLSLHLLQESARHAETLDAITNYLDMGTYSEWDEERKLEFLTRELKGKRPLVPTSIEVRFLDSGTWAMTVMIQVHIICEMKSSIMNLFLELNFILFSENLFNCLSGAK